MRAVSFRARLILGAGAVLALLIGLFFFSDARIGQAVAREAEERAQRGLDSVAWLLAEHVRFHGNAELASWFSDLAQRMGIRISYIIDGRDVADSAVAFDRLGALEDHGQRPEVLAALRGEVGMDVRRSATLDRDMLYIAKRMDAAAGIETGVLRLAVPLSDLRAPLQAQRRSLMAGFLAAGVVALAGSLILARSLGRSIRTFVSMAADIGAGGYDKRLWSPAGGEFRPLAEAVNAMAQGIEERIATIESQKNQLKAMFDGLAEGVLVLDADGRAQACNKAFGEIYPVGLDTLGRRLIEITREPRLQDAADSLLSGTRPAGLSLELPLPGERFVRVNLEPFSAPGGERRLVLVFHDLTLIRRGERALRDFVANVSHQLRTPLTSIKGFAETLSDNPPGDPAVSARFLATILKNAGHMERIIASMLALARSEQSGEGMRLEAVDAAAAVRRAAESAAPGLDARGVRISLDVPSEPLPVLAQAEGLVEAVLNLIENALRHGPERDGSIRIAAARRGGDVDILVRDNGPGIPLDLREKVFERFFRVDPNPVGQGGGAGLGLAISRQLARNFGGNIVAEDPPDGGPGVQMRLTLRAA